MKIILQLTTLIYLFSILSKSSAVNSQLNEDTGLLSRLLELLLDILGLGPLLFPVYPDAAYDEPDKHDTYDFIVVGSGPTGSVLANRLTEASDQSVLLLEAGEEATPLTDIPFICGLFEFSNYNWGYKTEKQDGFCRGCIGKTMEWPHGKALGGSSTINYMIFVRGNKLDYDKWAEMGNPGWSYEEVLPYFLKMEDDHIKLGDKGYHSKGGYLTVTDIPYRSRLVNAYVKSAEEAGYTYVDYNGKTQMGVSYVQGTLRDGARCNAEKAYLRPARDRKNLEILIRAHVVKVLINPETKVAYGVKYFRDGKYYKAYARKEVILSAGSLNTPQLLMLSGIGPNEHLKDLDIPVVQNLPVGKKMYDHAIFVGVMFQVNESIVINRYNVIANLSAYLDFFLNGEGSFTTIGGVESLTYMKSKSSDDPDPTYPNLEFMTIGGSLATDVGLIYRRMFNIPSKTYNKIWEPLEGKSVYQIFPILLHPKSYGYIKLRSKNPFDPPLFYANYFSDPENQDIKAFIEGIREIQRINMSPALQKYGSTLVKTPIPECENYNFNSDDYWECALRSIVGSQYHQVATCKMGPKSDPEAVVDANLRVYGIKRLRVADTSVIPLSVSAHTVAIAYMIGEKAADLLKRQWEL